MRKVVIVPIIKSGPLAGTRSYRAADRRRWFPVGGQHAGRGFLSQRGL